MLASCFLVSCDNGAKNTQTAGSVVAPTDTVDTSKVYDAPVKDLGGHEFVIYAKYADHVGLGTHEIFSEGYNGDKINDAVYTRNLQIEEKYNCTITMSPVSGTSAYVSKIKDPLLAGDYVCDMMFGRLDNHSTLMLSNLLVDLTTLQNIDLSKAWYDDFSMSKITFEGKAFTAIGDAATLDDRTAWIMYFNKALVNNYDPELNLYQKVREGEWTIDLLYEIMENTWFDNDGDGALTPGKDRFGYITERSTNWYHVNACNTTLSIYNGDGTYTIPDSPKQDLLDTWAALRKVLASPYREVSDKSSNFKSGLGTFFACNAGTLLTISDTPFDYGVLPLPKLNKEQDKYYTGVENHNFCGYAIPVTASNDPNKDWQKNGFESGEEQSAYFLELFSYYSMIHLTPAFFDQVCLKQAVVDVDSQEMVIMALENKIIDPVVMFNWGSINIFSEVGSPKAGVPGSDENWETLTSTYESRVGAARTAMEQFLEGLRNLGA
ncbi:MAG: hypothetical protein IKD31_06325 [Clostridia bacterium]|nr:hypothetical protein [Clostridia bacterium]